MDVPTPNMLVPPTNTFSFHWWHFTPWQTDTMMASPVASF
jgi:hypothetical protein